MANDEKLYCVYKHTSPSNKVYIGITCQTPQKLWKSGGRGYKNNQYFWRAIQKYGWDNFDHEVLFDGINKSDAVQKEKELISFYNSNNKQYGYNLSTGGDGGREGVTLSEGAKRRISEANHGRKLSEELREQIRERTSGENNPFYGKRHTKEAKEKIRQKAIGRKDSDEVKLKKSNATKGGNNPRAKITLQYDMDGNFITSWGCAKYAASELNICSKGITACCRGVRKSAGGFIWRYQNEYNSKD